MIKIIILPLLLGFSLSAYSQKPSFESVSNKSDSIKKIIISLNDELVHSIDNPEKYRTFCEDSMLVVGADGEFETSSNALSQDLHAYSILPHDYTFKLFGNTAVLSYLCTRIEVFNGDTILRSVRDLKTFMFNKGRWKVISYSFGFQPVNYFKPVAEINQRYYPSYAGVYKVNNILDTFFVKDGKLYDRSGDVTWDFPINNSEYMTNENLERVVFGKDFLGIITYLTIVEPDGQKFRCPKIK